MKPKPAELKTDREDGMRAYSRVPNRIGALLAFMLLAGCVAPPVATRVTAPPLAPETARVWFLRQADPPGGNIYAAAPLIYIDRKQFAQIQQALLSSMISRRDATGSRPKHSALIPTNTISCIWTRGWRSMSRS